MKAAKPVDGKFSFYQDSRKRGRGDLYAPAAPTFVSNPIRSKLACLVEGSFEGHPRSLDANEGATTQDDAKLQRQWVREIDLSAARRPRRGSTPELGQ